jgi:hypothetical protein
MEIQYSSLRATEYAGQPELTRTSFAVGPWLRLVLARMLDGRAELIAAADLQYARQSVKEQTDTDPTRSSASANGYVLRLGPRHSSHLALRDEDIDEGFNSA